MPETRNGACFGGVTTAKIQIGSPCVNGILVLNTPVSHLGGVPSDRALPAVRKGLLPGPIPANPGPRGTMLALAPSSSLLAPQRAQPVRCFAQSRKAQPVRAAPREQQQLPGLGRQLAAGLLGAAAAVSLVLAPPASAAEPFLKSTGTSCCLLP